MLTAAAVEPTASNHSNSRSSPYNKGTTSIAAAMQTTKHDSAALFQKNKPLLKYLETTMQHDERHSSSLYYSSMQQSLKKRRQHLKT